jgi:hypothetical protein
MDSAYPIAAEALDLEVYVLAALFAGSGGLAALEPEMPGIRWVRSTFEFPEISRRLISLAVMLRSLPDASTRRSARMVGQLIPDIAVPSQIEDLPLREACNQIIHAQTIDLAPGRWEGSEHPSISRVVVLEGSYRDCEWRAELDTLAFLDAASRKF